MNIRKSNGRVVLTASRFALMISLLVCFALVSGKLYAADIENGKKVFAKCQICHTVEKDVSKVGPSLYGVFGRKSGTLASFPGYSEAMKTANVVWKEDTLSEFLKAPRTYVPKTIMVFPWSLNAKEISDLLAYLKSVTGAK